jgi:hypothetical protein
MPGEVEEFFNDGRRALPPADRLSKSPLNLNGEHAARFTAATARLA